MYLLVVSDYFSNYIKVAHLCSTTKQAVVREFASSRFGIPEILVTDNGPQFSSNEFQVFAKSGLSIMSLHRLATLSQMARLRILCGQ